MRIFAISNIHGYYDEFMALLDNVQYNAQEDKLFILGDLIDYGPKSIEVVNKCMELKQLGAVVLRGCREQLYLTAFTHEDEEKRNATEEKLISAKNHSVFYYLDKPEVKDDHMKFFKSLPLYKEYESYFFSHAGIDIGGNSNIFNYVWSYDFYKQAEAVLGHKKTYVFGHTSVLNMENHKCPDIFAPNLNMIGINTMGAYNAKGGYLTLVSITERKSWSIKIEN